MYPKAAILSAFVAVAAAQSSASEADSVVIDPAMISAYAAPYASVSGMSEIMSFAQKYATVSGFDKFALGAYSVVADFTATADTKGIPTPTGTAVEDVIAEVQTNTAIQNLAGDFAEKVGLYIATETYLPSSIKKEMVNDLASVTAMLSGVLPDSTGASSTESGGSDANASSVPEQGNSAGRVMIGVSGLVAGLVAVGAALL